MTGPTAERAEFTEKIESRITETVREFQDLELEQMRKGEIAARAKLAHVRKAVDEKRAEAQTRLATARKSTAAAWDEAREGVETAWTELSDAVERARAELKGEGAEAENESEEAVTA